MEDSLLEKTGKPLKHWISIVDQSGIEKHGDIIKLLKTTHNFTHGFANFVAHKARKSDAASHDSDELLKNQYKGKEQLMAIYEGLLKEISALGSDITITPKKDSVSFIRKNQFALIKPATKSRVDLGLKIKAQEPEGILQNSGPFGAMCSHRIVLEQVEDINSTLVHWLQKAYAQSV